MNKSDLSYFSEADFQDIFNFTKDRLSMNKTIQNKPIAFVLGGQPGAGKTGLHAITKFKLKNDVITIDNDTFKPLHPNYDVLVEKYGKNYVEHVTPFSNRLTEELIDHFSKLKFNLTVEGTLRTAETPMKTAALLKERGYEVNLYVMAVSKDLSYLGTLERYESMYLDSPQTARSTDELIHNETVTKLPDNLDALYNSDLFADISLFTREGTEVYSTLETPDKSPKKVIYDALHEVVNKEVMIDKIDRVIYLSEQNNHPIQDLLDRKEKLNQNELFSLDGIKNIDSKIKANQLSQDKIEKRNKDFDR